MKLLWMGLIISVVVGCNPWIDEDLGTEGGECFPETADCIGDLVCRDWQCEPRGQEGDDCDDGYYDIFGTCDPDLGLICYKSVCALRGDEGDDCEMVDEYGQNTCKANLVCIDSSCEPAGDKGDDCTLFRNGSSCAEDLVCFKNICEEPGEAGDECEWRDNETCREDLHCSAATDVCED